MNVTLNAYILPHSCDQFSAVVVRAMIYDRDEPPKQISKETITVPKQNAQAIVDLINTK